MGRKKNYYLTLDTETCTLPFANELCRNEKQKQTIAIAKPIVYDIGWTIFSRLPSRRTKRLSTRTLCHFSGDRIDRIGRF